MNKTTVQEKIFRLQGELEFIKQAFREKPDFDVDEKIWKEIKPTAKKIRKKLYQSRYGKK
ncbi:hypothetical protein KKA09_01660 [Patescibacteria group bacterium]|nr:hypothetical protein [Patescibacteria group bacterium]